MMRHFRLYRHMTDGSRSRRMDIATAFFNGSGMFIWEQYGTYTPWSNEDRRLWRHASIIRGGSFQRNSGSSWFLPSGPQPCTYHAKFILMWPGLDRCATVGFRCMKPIAV